MAFRRKRITWALFFFHLLLVSTQFIAPPEKHPPINLDYQRVNDVGWVDSESIVISVCERLGRGDGGMGLFSSSNGELRYKFQVSHENQVESFTAGALSFGSDYSIFSSCKGRSNEYGVGVWDLMTGKQTDFFYRPAGRSAMLTSCNGYVGATVCWSQRCFLEKTTANFSFGIFDFGDNHRLGDGHHVPPSHSVHSAAGRVSRWIEEGLCLAMRLR